MTNSKNQKHAIIMVGAPGSGKGTQGEILEKNTKFKRYVMSTLIKKTIKKNKELEKKINSGVLISNEEVFEIFRKNFKFEKKVIVDGIPRTLDQAYWLYGFLVENGYNIEVIYLKVNEKKLLKRIIKRGRKDDNPKVFEYRLKEFDKAKKFILKVYNKEIITVNGDRKIEIISKDILSKLKTKKCL